MTRTYVVTGSASGIGAATRRLLEEQGHRVIGVDLRDAEVIADLSTAAGRAVLTTIGAADAVVACAGVSGVTSPPELVVRLNLFGAVATLEGLRPALARATDPRAVVVGSTAALYPVDESLVDACLGGDEERSVRLATQLDGARTYTSCKRALVRWVRRASITPAWAGAGIPLNAVGPGVISSGMTRDRLADPETRRRMEEGMPMPLKWPGEPEDIAAVLAFLASPANTLITGQHVLADGGFDAAWRGDDSY